MAKDDFAIREGSGLDLIIKERERQISEEGWTPEHDEQHDGDQLARAAACYAVHETRAAVLIEEENRLPNGMLRGRGARFSLVDAWPWDEKWDKREKHDHLKRLTIAGALIAADIDRILATRA